MMPDIEFNSSLHTSLGAAVSERRVNEAQAALLMMSCTGYWLTSSSLELKQYIFSANNLLLQGFFFSKMVHHHSGSS